MTKVTDPRSEVELQGLELLVCLLERAGGEASVTDAELVALQGSAICKWRDEANHRTMFSLRRPSDPA